MKTDKFDIVRERRFSSFILRGLEKSFQAKKFYGLTGVALFIGRKNSVDF